MRRQRFFLSVRFKQLESKSNKNYIYTILLRSILPAMFKINRVVSKNNTIEIQRNAFSVKYLSLTHFF